jgi:acyl carrier protein
MGFMESKFMDVMAEMFEVDANELSMDIEYKNYEKWDSLKMMNIVMELEDAFDISIPLEKISNVKTLKDLYDIVQGK